MKLFRFFIFGIFIFQSAFVVFAADEEKPAEEEPRAILVGATETLAQKEDVKKSEEKKKDAEVKKKAAEKKSASEKKKSGKKSAALSVNEVCVVNGFEHKAKSIDDCESQGGNIKKSPELPKAPKKTPPAATDFGKTRKMPPSTEHVCVYMGYEMRDKSEKECDKIGGRMVPTRESQHKSVQKKSR